MAHPELKEGSDGPEVTILQELLVQTPWLNIDGKFGPITEALVKAFQSSKGLHPDGIVGPLTWAALDPTP